MSTHTHTCKKCYNEFKCNSKLVNCNIPFCSKCYKLWDQVKTTKQGRMAFWNDAGPKFYAFLSDDDDEDTQV